MAVGSIPAQLDVPLFFGSVRKGSTEQAMSVALNEWIDHATSGKPKVNHSRPRLDPNSLSHLFAYHQAMNRADNYLTNTLSHPETGQIIAEDVPVMRNMIKQFGLIHRESPLIGVISSRPSLDEKEKGVPPQGIDYEIKSIEGDPIFLQKQECEMLQFADVAAYIIRKYLSGGSYGVELLKALLGPTQADAVIKDPRWMEGWNGGLFNY